MKYLSTLLLATLFLLVMTPVSASEAKAPKEIGGFKLGSSINDYEFTSYTNFLKQVVVEDVGAFRKGVIEYGVCERPGEIVKIKLKYKDQSESFYRTLLDEYKKQLGKPDKFTGDPFGILKSWKWHFTDENGERVSISFQYNQKNFDESMGSVVKMSLPQRIEQERACFNQFCSARQEESGESSIPQQDKLDFIIPR
jgi:hypothetical protein